ncbi:MAG: polymer-forming cytoskeletal protein [Magnetococcales bacterium]|nr:polymer-forming cytoskeletal protein [Magnetococcales bacterium]
MALFAAAGQSKADRSNTAIIAAGTKVTGEVRVDCRLHIDGELVGPIHSTNLVSVGRKGRVEGEVHASKLIVSGNMFGNADCDEIEILAGGRMVGQVYSRKLVMDPKSIFEGESQTRSPAGTQDSAQTQPQEQPEKETGEAELQAFYAALAKEEK